MRYLLHDDFIKAAKQWPNKPAVIMEDSRQITYHELDQLSNQFAWFFKQHKALVRENPYVGVLSPVHIESIAAVLGTLKMGCAYVPLDDQSPVERLKHIIKNTQLDILVVDKDLYYKLQELFAEPSLKHIVILSCEFNELPEKIVSLTKVLNFPVEHLPLLNQVSDDLAYVLHTSGSTGIPKGIMLTHRNARTFVDWMQKEFALTSEDIVMSRAPFKFDLSVFDIFNTFKVGGTLVCYDWNKNRLEPEKHLSYSQLIADQKATILYTTPSTFISLMNRGQLGRFNLSLRTVMYAGEPFPVTQLKKLKDILGECRIANIYGPTETNIITYYWIGTLPKEDSSIPLGYEVEDTEILIVSEDGKRICAPDEIGELWCRGGTVTLGYLGLPHLTEKHFVNSPFHHYPTKFWRTGDYGLRDKENVLHYRGRKDHMVKIKGYRVEIGEVETAISRHPALDEFVVVATQDPKNHTKLCCFFSLIYKQLATEEDLKSFLLQILPDYMVPFHFFSMESLPKTTSGKVDRVLLAEKAEALLKRETIKSK